MDVERCLITRVVDSGSIGRVIESGVRTEFFRDADSRKAWAYIRQHYDEFDEVPTEAVLDRHTGYELLDNVKESIEYLVEELKRQRAYSLLSGGVSTAAQALKASDVTSAQSALADAIQQVGIEVTTTRDTDYTEDYEDRAARYQAYSEHGGLVGIPTGFPTFDRATQGLQPEQLITIAGPQKAGKTTYALKMADNIHHLAKRVLWIGFEMSNQQIELYLDAMRLGCSYRELQNKWSPKLEKRLAAINKETENMPPFVLSGDIAGATTLAGVSAKIKAYSPHVVFIDGVYLMDTDDPRIEKGTPQHIRSLTQGFKRMAQRFGIPIVITTQILEWKISKKKGITTDSIGFSTSFGQDSDALIGIQKTDEPTEREMRILDARHAPPIRGIMCAFDWETANFSELEEYEAAEYEDDDSTATY